MEQAEACRTVVVSGVPDLLPPSRMADKLTIHFQRSRNFGGDVDKTQYPTNVKGVAFVTFEDIKDANRVVQKNHVIEDCEFPDRHPVTVFKFSQDMFFYVRAEVDASIFSGRHGLMDVLKANHRSVRISLLQSNGMVVIEGTFQAVKRLREDLTERLKGAGRHSASLVGGCSQNTVQTQKEVIWVDSAVFAYVQQFHGDHLKSCFSKYPVEVNLEKQADLTVIIVTGKDGLSVTSAKLEMEHLVNKWQSSLRTQRIEYRSLDRRRQETLIALCSEISRNFSDILLIPQVSCVEVVGPSASSYDFCMMVEDRRSAVVM